jgi:ABC-2 type transport system permease protein
MPIHDQGYRRYEGSRSAPGRRWAVIARAGIRSMFTKKTFIGLLLLAWFPFVIYAVRIYIVTNFPQVPREAVALIQVTPAMWKDFLGGQDIFVFFITVYVGAGLIASDRRANALQIYLSKPLTRAEYIFGKLAVLMAFLLLVTWVPAMLLLLLQVLFPGELTFLRENLYLLPAITVFALVQSLTASATMLALSSLSKSSRFVGILYAVVIFLSQAIYGVLRAVTGDTQIAWVSFSANLMQVGSAVFRVPAEYATPWQLSLGIILGLIVGSAIVLERRVRGVEVVI